MSKKTLVYQKVNKPKMELACFEVMNLLRGTLKLEPFECYYVVKTLFESFPVEDLTSLTAKGE